MKIADDADAKGFHFGVDRQKIGHHDGHHAGSRCGADAVVRILERKAELGCDAEPFGCKQEWLRMRLSERIIAVSDDRLESMRKAMGFEMMPRVLVAR